MFAVAAEAKTISDAKLTSGVLLQFLLTKMASYIK